MLFLTKLMRVTALKIEHSNLEMVYKEYANFCSNTSTGSYHTEHLLIIILHNFYFRFDLPELMTEIKEEECGELLEW